MHYFRYKNTNKNINNALKEQYKKLIVDEKRTIRKGNWWLNFSITTTLVVYFSLIITGIFLLKTIPLPYTWFLKLLVVIFKIVIGIILFIAGFFLSIGLTIPLWKKVELFHIPSMKKAILAKACEHLRDYYELQKPYIITKCFDATEKKFKNHDVCIFVFGEELRLTTDLVRGFLHSERDLGCYVFKQDEIMISKQKDGNRFVAELKVDNTVFILGYRAKSFIEKNFIKTRD